MAMKIGEKIKVLRKAKNISQETLANTLGVTFQAVSKWETGATAPDIALIPPMASFFDVSIDELFDYHTWENEQTVDEICRRAYARRCNDPEGAEEILREGLKQFPANEKLLTVLVYTLWAISGRDEDLEVTCKALLDCATDAGVKCDVLRFLAMTYHRKGSTELIQPVLDQIPEFYFTKLECVAKLTGGKQSLEAAQFQMNLSANTLVEMLGIMEMRYAEDANSEAAALCRRLLDGVLSVFRNEGGKSLETPGYEWIGN